MHVKNSPYYLIATTLANLPVDIQPYNLQFSTWLMTVARLLLIVSLTAFVTTSCSPISPADANISPNSIPSAFPSPTYSPSSISTPAPSRIFFPQQIPTNEEQGSAAALLTGNLIIVNNCLRITVRNGAADYLIIWPTHLSLDTKNNPLKIQNKQGQTVARVGDQIHLGGGEVPTSAATWLSTKLRNKLPDTCPGPYWLASDIIQ